MKRRTFISTLAAAAVAPALPATPAVAISSSHVSQYFAKAKLLARCHDRASPEMFARLMKLDTQTAQSLFKLLKDRAVIAPGLDGITRAINPLNTHCVPNEAVRARDLAQISSDLSDRLREMGERRLKASNVEVDEAPAPKEEALQEDEDDTAQKAQAPDQHQPGKG